MNVGSIGTDGDSGKPHRKREHEIRFPDKFWRSATPLSHVAKGLYATLATFADYRTGLTFVSNERLQKETGFGRDKVERLLRELECGGYIERTRQCRRNLRWKRWVKCLRYVSSDSLIFRASDRHTENQGTENQGYIRTPVKSSVTPERQEKSSFPCRPQNAERIM